MVKDGSAVVNTNIQQAFGSNDSPVVRAFLNGYEATSQVVQISVNPSNLQGTTLSIRISLGKTTQVKSVWISWIAFSPVTASFTAYGGSLSRNGFIGTFNSDISSNLYQNSYLLYGLTTLSLTGTDALAFTFQISNTFQLSLSSSRIFESFGLVYIVAGNAPSKLCSACGNNNKAFGNTCLSSCPLGTTANTYKDGGVACLGTALTVTASMNTTPTSAVSISVNATATSQVSTPPVLTSTVTSSAASSASVTVSTPSVVAPTPSVNASRPSIGFSGSSGSSSSSSVKVTCPANAFFNGIECVC